MTHEDFDPSFQRLTKSLVELAFEYVHFNSAEVETIYFFGSLTHNDHFNNFFFRIRGQVVAGTRINTLLEQQADLSPERAQGLFRLAAEDLAQLEDLFRKHGRDVPCTIRIAYAVPRQSLQLKLDYELQRYDLQEVHMAAIFLDWLQAVKKDAGAAFGPL